MNSCDNNREIFGYLNPNGNEMLSLLNNSDRYKVISLLNKYYLELRDRIGVSSDITFGVEIECDDATTKIIDDELNRDLAFSCWKMEPDGSIPKGIEVISPVLRDNRYDWFDLSNVCKVIGENANLTETLLLMDSISMFLINSSQNDSVVGLPSI